MNQMNQASTTSPRITLPTLLVLKCLLPPSLPCTCSSGYNPECPSTHGAVPSISGFQLAITSGVARGSVYPLLYRLEECGWVKGSTVKDGSSKRTPLRVYRLTEVGRKNTESILKRLRG